VCHLPSLVLSPSLCGSHDWPLRGYKGPPKVWCVSGHLSRWRGWPGVFPESQKRRILTAARVTSPLSVQWGRSCQGSLSQTNKEVCAPQARKFGAGARGSNQEHPSQTRHWALLRRGETVLWWTGVRADNARRGVLGKCAHSVRGRVAHGAHTDSPGC
jgi:hypothetical protein